MGFATTDPPPAAAALYFGDVMHARLRPRHHRFAYRVMSLLIDLDRLDQAGQQSFLFGINRRALYSFHEDGLRSGLGVAEALGAVAPWRTLPAPLAEAAE